MEKENQEQPLQVEIDDQTARGQYANMALITHSETEVLFDFLFLQPQSPKTKVLSRVISSPVHAKRFLWALQENIAKYEERFGKIDAEQHLAGSKAGFYQ